MLRTKQQLKSRAALWTNRKVVLVLSQKEAGATPVKAPNEGVTQMDRVLASEASGHRFDPCHPRCCALILEAYIQ